MSEQITEPLIGKQEFQYTGEELTVLFDPNNIKDLHDGTDVSEAVHQLQHKCGGVDSLARSLLSNSKLGLGDQTEEQRIQRDHQYGKNTRKPRKIKTLCNLLCECFEDRILQILVVAAGVSLIAGIYSEGWQHGWLDGVAIMMAIVIICTVTASQGYVKEKQFQELVKKQDLATAIVFRNGEPSTIDSEDLQVGDILKVEAGKACPADAVLVASNQVLANESAQTGEPDELHKNAVTQENYESNPNPFLLQGSLIVNGEGRALVLAVGKNTQSGKAEQTLDIENDQTPLQAKLETIANEIGKVGLYVAILTFIALSIRLLIKVCLDDSLDFFDMENLLFLIDALIIGITVVVVAVPEGLPLAVTIALAFSVQKMFEEKNLVRKLGASETMGGANEICTDKTGTLTQNNMTVMAIYMEDRIVEGSKYEGFKDARSHQEVLQSVLYNCSAFIETLDTGEQQPKGNVTEVGLVKYLMTNEIDVKDILNSKEQREEFTIPFNSKLKRAGSAYRKPEGGVRVFCKGAPEQVILFCNSFLGEGGEKMELTQSKKDAIVGDDVIKNFAKRCFRTILVAYADFTDSEWEQLKNANNQFQEEEDKNAIVKDLTMAGIFGIMDPLRPGIKDAVKRCHASGINIRMVTGDNVDTATAISLDAGIITQEDLDDNDDGYVCMLGKDFREICGDMITTVIDEEKGTTKMSIGNVKSFKEVCNKLKVLARSKPEDKFMLVTGLMEIFKSVVAVTGDGTNDVPALNKADVGFAMGIAGTDPAKNAADIVLVDDNFSSILVAVLYGRNIYDNVRKFLQFQLTVNVVAMFIVFSGAIIFAASPLTSVQMLWVNMIMDTFAALALSTEPPQNSLLDRKPQSRTETIVNNVMWRNIIGQSLYQIAVLLLMLFVGPTFEWYKYQKSVNGVLSDYGEVTNEDFYCNEKMLEDNPGIICDADEGTHKLTLYTMVFQTFVFMQVFNQVNARKLGEREFNVFKGFFNNCYFLFIMLVTIVVQMLLVELGGRAVRCAQLDWYQNGICLGIGAFSLIWGLVIKFIPASLFNCLAIKEEPLSEDGQEATIQAMFRKSATLSQRKMNESQTNKSQVSQR